MLRTRPAPSLLRVSSRLSSLLLAPFLSLRRSLGRPWSPIVIAPRLPSLRALWLGTIALSLAACGSHIPVETGVAPHARLVRIRNFMILNPPGAAKASASADPVVRNPLTLHTIGFELLLAFQARGYFADTAAPDFAVAYYVGSHLPIDTAVFDYGYPFEPYGWWHDEPAALQPTRPDSQAILIVDVVSPKTKALLWRGEAVARLSAQPGRYADTLKQLVDAIVGQFQAGMGGGPVAPAPLPHGGRMR